MYLCYIDESGTPDLPGNTSHFILAGVSIPIWHWRTADAEISAIKNRFSLTSAELHTAWLLRKYLEQSRIPNFETLSYAQRRREVAQHRHAHLLQLQKLGGKSYRQTKKNYEKTSKYVHLTLAERTEFVRQVAKTVSAWGFARIFAECIDKLHFDPDRSSRSVDEQAFEQVISRFETYLQKTDGNHTQRNYGLVVHDNNETVARKHTRLMRQFHAHGTLWTPLERTIETPLFVDSSLTSMVQVADLCAYALRRYVENEEADLFKLIYTRADRSNDTVVGVRHFSKPSCKCEICRKHR